MRQLRVGAICSTGGSVISKLAEVEWFRARLHLVVTDRACAAEAVADHIGVPVVRVEEPDRDRLSAGVDAALDEHEIDVGLLFFTRLLEGPILAARPLVNVHPSLLPAFKGLSGFEQTMASGSRWVGSTIHFIDAELDEGITILQSTFPIDPSRSAADLRHRLFVQQCRGVLQVLAWMEAGRVHVRPGDRRAHIHGAAFHDHEFAPALDDPVALAFDVPVPR